MLMTVRNGAGDVAEDVLEYPAVINEYEVDRIVKGRSALGVCDTSSSGPPDHQAVVVAAIAIGMMA